MAAVLTSKKQTVTVQIPKQGDLLFEGRAKELFAFENQSLIENPVIHSGMAKAKFSSPE
jgi:hypothetical protein